MTQSDILHIMKKKKRKWWTILELAKRTNINQACVSRALGKMAQYGFVKRTQSFNSDTGSWHWRYIYSR